MSRFYVVQGQTEPIDVQLLRANQPVDLSGLPAGNVTLILRQGLSGTLVDTTDDVTVFDAPTGKVRYSPPADAFDPTQSPYVGRWKVVDGAGKIGFWPSRDLDHWIVGR